MIPDETKVEICRDFNKSVIEISWRAINATFLLNGATATALFSKSYQWQASLFALGAFFAVISFGLAYCTNLALIEVHKPEGVPKLEYRLLPWKWLRPIKAENAELFRQQTIYFWFGALAFFLLGLTAVLSTVLM